MGQRRLQTTSETMRSLKPFAKKALMGLYKYSGAARAGEAFLWRTGQGFMSILLFHRVTDAIPEDGLTVGTARFRAVCTMLRKNFRVVPLAEVFDTVRARRPMVPRTVAVTFDDCYRDNLFAARVLKEIGLPACFFVPTGYVGTDHVFPWDRHLPPMPNLSWDEVREMAAMGFEIGSHTVTHCDLGAVSPAQAWEEVVTSKAEIERQLRRSIRWFAYPFGGPEHFRPEWVPLLREAGYEGCVSAHCGFVRLSPTAEKRDGGEGTDDFVLPREAVPSFQSALHLELFLSGSLDWYYKTRKAQRRYEPVPTSPPPVLKVQDRLEPVPRC
jgi:hypothetical protein